MFDPNNVRAVVVQSLAKVMSMVAFLIFAVSVCNVMFG